AELPSERHQPLEEATADALAAPAALDVDGQVRHVVVGRPGVEGVEARPPDHAGVGVLGDDYRMAGAAGGPPPAAVGRRAAGPSPGWPGDPRSPGCRSRRSPRHPPPLPRAPRCRPCRPPGETIARPPPIRKMNWRDPDDQQYFEIDGRQPRPPPDPARGGEP